MQVVLDYHASVVNIYFQHIFSTFGDGSTILKQNYFKETTQRRWLHTHLSGYFSAPEPNGLHDLVAGGYPLRPASWKNLPPVRQ